MNTSINPCKRPNILLLDKTNNTMECSDIVSPLAKISWTPIAKEIRHRYTLSGKPKYISGESRYSKYGNGFNWINSWVCTLVHTCLNPLDSSLDFTLCHLFLDWTLLFAAGWLCHFCPGGCWKDPGWTNLVTLIPSKESKERLNLRINSQI